MKKRILAMLAIAAALCACNKEQNTIPEIPSPDAKPQEELVFKATMEGTGTKAILDGMTPSWEVGDRIYVNGVVFQAKSAGTSTEFTLTVPDKEIRPTYVSTTTPGHYGNLDASKLVDDSGTTNEWCTPTSAKVDGVWNIVVSTGNPTVLKTIKLWNARNTVTNYGRTWKKVKVYGSASSDGSWALIGDFDNLNLAINNYGFAGELEINATEAYTYYKIDVLENKGGTGDDYMQMSDMKFVVGPSVDSPYHAYFPEKFQSLYPDNLRNDNNKEFCMPMYAYSTTNELQFKNVGAVLKIVVNDIILPVVNKIRVSSANKATSGAFTVVDNTAVLNEPNNPGNNVVVDFYYKIATTAGGTAFYVAIPAQTYRNLKIEISPDGMNFPVAVVTKRGMDIEVLRNNIYEITIKPNCTDDYTLSPISFVDSDFE